MLNETPQSRSLINSGASFYALLRLVQEIPFPARTIILQ